MTAGLRELRDRLIDEHGLDGAVELLKREELRHQLDREEREAAEHREAMRRMAGCTCGEAGRVHAVDLEHDERGTMTYVGCAACGAGAQLRGSVVVNVAHRRRATFRERARSSAKLPARARVACALIRRRPASSGRPRGRRPRRAGPGRSSNDGSGSDGPGEGGHPEAAAPNGLLDTGARR